MRDFLLLFCYKQYSIEIKVCQGKKCINKNLCSVLAFTNAKLFLRRLFFCQKLMDRQFQLRVYIRTVIQHPYQIICWHVFYRFVTVLPKRHFFISWRYDWLYNPCISTGRTGTFKTFSAIIKVGWTTTQNGTLRIFLAQSLEKV